MNTQHKCRLKYLFNSALTFIKKNPLDSRLCGPTLVGQNVAICFCLPWSLLISLAHFVMLEATACGFIINDFLQFMLACKFVQRQLDSLRSKVSFGFFKL